MMIWEDLLMVLERGRFALAVAPFEFLPESAASGPCFKHLLTDNVDAACRHFALHRQWPAGLAVCEKKILAQRLLFGLTTLQAMLKGQQTFLLNANLPPAFAAQGSPAALEWLLITVWKLGGAKVMSELEEIIFTGTRHVELVSKIFQTNAPQPASSVESSITAHTTV